MKDIRFRAWDCRECEIVDHAELIFDPDSYLVELIQGDYVDSLMRYIGIQDNRGFDIYEGDILSFPDGFISEVKWCNDTLGWIFIDPVSGARLSYSDIADDEFMIIGNIYQNPELLEG